MNAAKSLIATLLLAAASLAPAAHATVITFNNLTGASNIVYTPSLTNSGFNFVGANWSYVTGSDYASQSDSGVFAYNSSDFYMTYQGLTVTSVNASPFKLNSIDLVGWYSTAAGNKATLTGFKAGGGTVTQTVDLSTVANGLKRTGNDFTTYSLTGFDNLNSLTITHNFSDYLAIDNFVVNATQVPEPSSLALFGLAVAAGAFARRRAGKAA